MPKKVKILVMLLAAILLLNGCGLLTLEELYYPPKRAEEDDDLQSLIDEAMNDLTYCAPISGENRQAMQKADLDGDGVDEYLLLAKDDSEKPLKILIFRQVASGYVLMDTIEGYGFAFDFVDFVQMDDRDGLEIVVGRQVSEELPRSVSVYRFTSDFARQLLSTGYNGKAVCDLDDDGIYELVILSSGASEGSKGLAVCYSYTAGEMQRTDVCYLSQSIGSLQQVETGLLEDGTPAVFATSAINETTLNVDVLIMADDSLENLSGGITINAVRNYLLYPTDIDSDGVVELPRPIEMPSASEKGGKEYILQWYSVDKGGNKQEKAHTYYHYTDGWYLFLDVSWERSLAVEQTEDGCVFYRLDAVTGGMTKLVTIYTFTGSDREIQAAQEGRLVLNKGESVIYAADLEKAASSFGITEESLLENFQPIRQEWNSEDSGDET